MNRGWEISTLWVIGGSVAMREGVITMTRQFTLPKVTEVPRGPAPKRPPRQG